MQSVLDRLDEFFDDDDDDEDDEDDLSPQTIPSLDRTGVPANFFPTSVR